MSHESSYESVSGFSLKFSIRVRVGFSIRFWIRGRITGVFLGLNILTP